MSNSYVDDVRPLSHDAKSAAPFGLTEAQIKAAAFNERNKVHTGVPARVYLLRHLNLGRHAARLERSAGVELASDFKPFGHHPVAADDQVSYEVPVALAIRRLELATDLRRAGEFVVEGRSAEEWDALAADAFSAGSIL
jgi:hypothetical protein